MSEATASTKGLLLYINELQAELSDSSTRLETILDIASDAIILIDSNQCIRSFNLRAAQIFGHTAEQVVGEPLDILLPQGIAETHRQHVREFSADHVGSKRMESRSVAISGRRRDGSTFPAEVAIAKLTHDGKRAFVAMLREVSKGVSPGGTPGSERTAGKSNLIIDPLRHTLTVNGHRLGLSTTEFALLAYLREQAPRVISSDELVREVHGYENDPAEARDIVRYHVYRIRRKLKAAAGVQDLIRTVRGVGYALGEAYL
jgi:PAS domain S-box-containing protein